MITQTTNVHFFDRLAEHRKIAAIKYPKHIEKAVRLKNRISGVFLLTGNISVIKGYVDYFKSEGLPVFIHLDKIGGLNADNEGIDFIANYVKPTGIVTTKPSLIIKAKKRGLLTVQRVFVIDSEVVENVITMMDIHKPDILEIMPARIPDVIKSLKEKISVPIVTGGLLSEEEQAYEMLAGGAMGISTSNTNVWKADLSSCKKLKV